MKLIHKCPIICFIIFNILSLNLVYSKSTSKSRSLTTIIKNNKAFINDILIIISDLGRIEENALWSHLAKELQTEFGNELRNQSKNEQKYDNYNTKEMSPNSYFQNILNKNKDSNLKTMITNHINSNS